MKNLMLSIAVLMAMAGAQSVSAQDVDKGHAPMQSHRQRHQMHRINRGATTGQLTPAEEAKLKGQQQKIQADKEAAKADGTVTKGEKQKLNKEQDKADADIYKKKHNGATK